MLTAPYWTISPRCKIAGSPLMVAMMSLLLSACGNFVERSTRGAYGQGVHDTPPGPVPVERFAVDGEFFTVDRGWGPEPMWIRGINLGAAGPGTHPGQLALSEAQYRRWIPQMRALGFNVVRLQTRHFPRFYRVLHAYNERHPDAPMYLMQGIYLPESESGRGNLYDATTDFQQRIEETVDAIHGNLLKPETRSGAWGTYNVDVSPWTIGYIIGRELLANEVQTTDLTNAANTAFEGEFLKLSGANPSSVWATQQLDHLIAWERRQYHHSRPVGFLTWSTLDPLHHPTESTRSRTDIASIDLAEVEVSSHPPGHFIPIDAYPYYPYFVSEDPVYAQYTDAYGPNSYLGYLDALAHHYAGQTMLVAEFGVPSSWGRAKSASSGMHHGGLTELEQGQYAARLFENIYAVGAAGGLYFQWMDGWFKRIWIMRNRSFPNHRIRLWHNMMNPEQNYGLIGFDPPAPRFDEAEAHILDDEIREARVVTDATYLHLELRLDDAFAVRDDPLWIGFDTYGDETGVRRLPNGVEVPRAIEFALEIPARTASANLSVIASYNLFDHQSTRGSQPDHNPWEPILWTISHAHGSDDGVFQFPGEQWPAGSLRIRRADMSPSSLDAVIISENRIHIRLPWSLLHFSDPSRLEVIDPSASRNEARARTTEGIGFVIALSNNTHELGRVGWDPWHTTPPTVERLKAAAGPLARSLNALPEWIRR